MGKAGDPRGSFAWQQLRDRYKARARADGLPCGICGQAIDYAAPARTRGAAEVDHVVPIAVGGDALPRLDQLRIVHKSCNSARGDGTRRPPTYATSRDWF